MGGMDDEHGEQVLEDDDNDDPSEESDLECLNFSMSRVDEDRMRIPWKETLTIKLLGMTIQI